VNLEKHPAAGVAASGVTGWGIERSEMTHIFLDDECAIALNFFASRDRDYGVEVVEAVKGQAEAVLNSFGVVKHRKVRAILRTQPNRDKPQSNSAGPSETSMS
jgi:hypothetical protein